MLKITCDLVGKTPIGFSRAITSQKRSKEKHDDFETRTWKERAHITEEGELFIPPMALKNCLADIAKYLSETVPGKGKATYTKHFESGIMVYDIMPLGVNIENVDSVRVFVPSDGKRGGGTRVWKTFPIVKDWRVRATVYVTDETIGAEKVQEYLQQAGMFIGMGFWRPRRNGQYGRFVVENFKAEDCDMAATG